MKRTKKQHKTIVNQQHQSRVNSPKVDNKPRKVDKELPKNCQKNAKKLPKKPQKSAQNVQKKPKKNQKTSKTAQKAHKPKPKAVGAPTKYKPQFCQDLLDHMEKGGSKESFGAYLYKTYRDRKLLVSKVTVYNWTKLFPEFLNAMEGAEALSRMFWENLGTQGTMGNLRRIKSKTPVLTEEGKQAYDERGKAVEKIEYEPATFGQSSWKLNMFNRFKWHESVQHSGAIGGGPTEHLGDALKRLVGTKKGMKALLTIADKMIKKGKKK